MRIERLRWWYIEQVARMDADLFGAEAWSPAMFWNELANGHRYLVALDGDEVVGYGGVAITPPEAWIQNLGVRRDRQRAGVGGALLTELLAEAARHRVKAVLLEVAVDNGPAQRLYERYGFQIVGVRRGYYQPSNTDALVMQRDEEA